MSAVKAMCVGDAGKGVVIQGNMAFAVGCVRAGIHAADGYPGTPSTEVIFRNVELLCLDRQRPIHGRDHQPFFEKPPHVIALNIKTNLYAIL